MSCPLIVGLLTLTVIALAMTQSPVTSSGTPTSVLESCKALDVFNDTNLMEAKTFTKNLDECTRSKDVNKTVVATVLVDLVNKLNKHELANLTAYPEIMKQISKCARDVTGFNFTESETHKHFGLPNTVSFKFEVRQCEKSLELADCVEDVYAGQLNATTKRHKNAYMRLFDGIAPFCKKAWIRDDRNNSQYCLPSFTLILSGVLVIFKLIL